ncbi:MAG: hypothetical protein ACOC6P_03275 [Candidatus Aminicenantaceae bacterium]
MKTKQTKNKEILVLDEHDEDKEIEFELNYLASLTINERISLMENKSKEMKSILIKNGHRKTPQVIKRK